MTNWSAYCSIFTARKYCKEGFFYYKGLCTRNTTASDYRSAVDSCYDMEADVIGISRRDWAFVNQSEHKNERIWVKVVSVFIYPINQLEGQNVS